MMPNATVASLTPFVHFFVSEFAPLREMFNDSGYTEVQCRALLRNGR